MSCMASAVAAAPGTELSPYRNIPLWGPGQVPGASGDGPLDAPRQYQVRARIKGLSIAAGPVQQGVGRPGWLRADIDLQASELGGDARLAIADGAMEFPGVFERPQVPLRRFDAQLAWRIGAAQPQGRAIDLRVKDARFENDDARGELTMSWRTDSARVLVICAPADRRWM